MGEMHCEHYSYPAAGGPTCARGIQIEQRFKPRYPCWTANKPPEASATCPYFLAPTPEQLAARQKESQIRMEMMFTALVALEAWEATLGGKIPAIGLIDCPCCGKPEHLAVKIVRYHVYAACKTPGCVQFRGSRRR